MRPVTNRRTIGVPLRARAWPAQSGSWSLGGGRRGPLPLLALGGLLLPGRRADSLVPVGAHDEALHRDEMVEHGAMSRQLITPLDGLEDPAMVVVRTGRPPRRQERLLPTLGQEVDEGVDDPGDGAIVCAMGNGRVQRGVLRHARA